MWAGPKTQTCDWTILGEGPGGRHRWRGLDLVWVGEAWILGCGAWDPHLAPFPLPGVHSLRVAQGKKVGEAEGSQGLECEVRAPLTRHPSPQKYFIIMQSVFYPAGRIAER